MTQYARELLCEAVQELEPLLAAHHAEVIGARYPLEPRWAEYALLESLGRYTLFTARSDDKLVGYAAFFVDRSLHSASFVCARNDVFYVAPEKRRTAVPLGLLRYSHRQLKADGAQHVDYETTEHNMLGPILKRLGCETLGWRRGMNL